MQSLGLVVSGLQRLSRRKGSHDSLLISQLIGPVKISYIIPYITHFKEFRLQS